MVVFADAAERLIGAVQELSLARDLATVMAIVRKAARALTGADGATFVLRDDERCYYADEDAIEPLWKGQRFPIEACVSGWAMIHREALAIPDIYADPRVPADAYRPTFVKSLAMVPIRTAAPVGAIGTYWAKPHVASPDELRVLGSLANSTSIALENVRLYEELERRVEARTADLVRVQRQKEELVALIVHDLRSPANGIMLASQARLRHAMPETLERRNWQNVFSAAESIHRMAMNVLDVMRSEDGGLTTNRSDVALPQMLTELVDQMTPLATAQGVTLELAAAGAPATVVCDGEMLRRVLQNLIDNAVRYSPEGGTVRVEAELDDGKLVMRVRDQGPGVPVELRDAVFAKWTRLAREADRKVTGRGLGLAFCRSAIEAHGGTITIEDNPPHGAVFVSRIPL